MNKEEKRQAYLNRAAFARKDAADLIAQYGHGVRPSWVSTELALAQDQARRYTLLAKELERE